MGVSTVQQIFASVMQDGQVLTATSTIASAEHTIPTTTIASARMAGTAADVTNPCASKVIITSMQSTANVPLGGQVPNATC
ncbi:hypothetical protein DPMN_185705 [Dreissena polymorpha]|uniref:Uncharacterized protein n=1 Tax=Dreissena polymorpha TaxID=45954 RepID=A0A9D4DLX5_DREPO|nr:hypothetical protein DPMN_185705 [Dreissena polymorpha]